MKAEFVGGKQCDRVNRMCFFQYFAFTAMKVWPKSVTRLLNDFFLISGHHVEQ